MYDSKEIFRDLEFIIKSNKFTSEEIVDMNGRLSCLKSALTEQLISQHKNNPEKILNYYEFYILLNHISKNNYDFIESDKEVLDLIYEKLKKGLLKDNVFCNKSSYLKELATYYQTLIDTIIDQNSYNIERFHTESIAILINCCETLKKIDKESFLDFINSSTQKLADLYVDHIEYIQEYESGGYCDEDYTNWYEEVLTINPDNVRALKWLLEIKIEELENNNDDD